MNLPKIFKKTVSNVAQVFSQESDIEIIERIHYEFNTASERALEEALSILDGTKNIKKEKGELMEKLGFSSAKEAVKVQEVKKSIKLSEEKAKIIKKYSEKYPKYKFIFWDQVEEICSKYNLICGKSSLYKGDIPYKNLQEIANFKVEIEDEFYAPGRDSFYSWNSDLITPTRVKDWTNEARYKDYFNYHYSHKDVSMSNNIKLPFFICAPVKDMNIEGMKLKGSFLEREIPDPIVLHPMKDGALIVSAWGIEADDDLLKY